MGEFDNKTEILSQAIMLFKEEGAKFTLDALAKRLKISKKTIYKYYSGKENILDGAVDMFFDEIIVSHNVILKENISALDKLLKVITVYPDFYDMDDYRISEIEEGYPNIYLHIVERLEANWGLTFELMDECKKQGLISDINNEYLKMILVGLFENVLNFKNQKEILSECVTYIFNGIIKR